MEDVSHGSRRLDVGYRRRNGVDQRGVFTWHGAAHMVVVVVSQHVLNSFPWAAGCALLVAFQNMGSASER